jgi:hypothetical protein
MASQLGVVQWAKVEVWQLRVGGLYEVKFNEGLVCEAIVRRIESRDQRVRANVRFPEKEQDAFSVEATLEIGDQL